ncbi:MAG: glycan-binding surface protein [Alistipes sp.]
MKRSIIILTSMLLALGCSDEQVQYGDTGKPVVIGFSDPIKVETVTAAEIGQLIQIDGRNLRSVNHIDINGTELPDGTYTKLSNSIFLNIPRISRAEQFTLTLSNQHGTTSLPIEIIFPPFSISGLHNAWVKVGKELIVLGSCMDLHAVAGVSKVKIGDIEATVTEVAEECIKVIVPEGVSQNSPVTFTSADGTVVRSPINYCGGEFFLDGFENTATTRYPTWVVPNETYPSPLKPEPTEGDKYAYIKVDKYSGTLNMVGNYNVTIPNEYFTEKADTYSLRFELYTIIPIAYRLAVSLNQGSTWTGFGPASVTADENLMLSTNGSWQTCEIPMSKWKNKSGTKNFRVWVGSLPSNVKYDFCLDNFRIEKTNITAE